MITRFQRIIHRHGKWIFLLLLGFIIVAFLLWDYVGLNLRAQGIPANVNVYGRKINARELDTAKRRLVLNILLTSGRSVPLNEQANKWVTEQTLYRMALAEKARRLGITVTDDEVTAALKQIVSDLKQYFFKKAQSNEEAYNLFVSEVLLPRRLTEGDLELLIRENLALNKLLMTIRSTAKITPKQITTAASEMLERLTVSACWFELNDYMSQIKPTEKQLTQFYHDHPDRFYTTPKVQVDYVLFPITISKISATDQELQEAYEASRGKLGGKQKSFNEVRNELRRELIQQKGVQQSVREATEFTLKLVPEPGKSVPNFAELAKKNNLAIKQTPLFWKNELAPGVSTPEFVAAAFNLTPENSVSDPIASTEGVYVLHLLNQQLSVLQPYDQVKDAVRSAFLAEEALKVAREDGQKKRNELMILFNEGKTFEQAAGVLHLKVRSIKNFNMAEAMGTAGKASSSEDPFESSAQKAAFQVPAGVASDFIPNLSGGFFVYVHSRQKAKTEEIAKFEPIIRPSMIQMQQQIVIQDFQRSTIEEASLKLDKVLGPE